MENNVQEVAKVIRQMDNQLRKELDASPKKLWENTFIRHQIERRRRGELFSISDHIRAMVYAMLSAGITWERVEGGIDLSTGRIEPIDAAFYQFNPDRLLACDPAKLRDAVKSMGCASQYTRKQMEALVHVNIGKLVAIDKQYGGIDTYYQQFSESDPTLKSLVRQLASKGSEDKLSQMGEALTAEYLKNVGYDLAKPDRHICRILGSRILGCSTHESVPVYEAFDIIAAIAAEMGKAAAEVDYILWSYCAKGYGEICTAKQPKCEVCVANSICTKKGGIV